MFRMMETMPSISTSASHSDRPLVDRAITRTVAKRYAAAAAEIERIVEATYAVIARTGSVDPPMRAILREAGVSTQVFYRHFQSKDELMLVIIDDGRRRLADYLRHKMERAGDPVSAIGAWIEGTLAQAADAEAAQRTRPFVANLGHLQEQYPDEHRESVQVLVRLVEEAIAEAAAAGRLTSDDPHADAMAIYHLAQGSMELHLRERSAPPPEEAAHLVAFALRAMGVKRGT
jgi:AcrR family transcriptional regulator